MASNSVVPVVLIAVAVLVVAGFAIVVTRSRRSGADLPPLPDLPPPRDSPINSRGLKLAWVAAGLATYGFGIGGYDSWHHGNPFGSVLMLTAAIAVLTAIVLTALR